MIDEDRNGQKTRGDGKLTGGWVRTSQTGYTLERSEVLEDILEGIGVARDSDPPRMGCLYCPRERNEPQECSSRLVWS